MRRIARWAVLALLSLTPLLAVANPGIPLLEVAPLPGGGSSYSLGVQILMVMTLLTLLPALLITMTSFTRILVVLAILRQALGTAQTPSNQIILGLALFLSLFIMAPVMERVHHEALTPDLEESITFDQALERARTPFREFMFAQTRENDLMLFSELGGYGPYASQDEVPMVVLLPSFLTSELKTAFQIGFLLFVPFLVIDLVVASVLMSMGMMMLSPMLISLPFKLMLFVLVDGWVLVSTTLVSSFTV
ncbi:MAG: flagellar type III secretion system pore protein FliP [Parahaliea sp.]